MPIKIRRILMCLPLVGSLWFLMLPTLYAAREAHGGDPLLVEFVATARVVYQKLRLSNGNRGVLSPAQSEAFRLAIDDGTRVELSLTELRDARGAAVTSQVIDDPENAGKKLIRIYRVWWKEFLNAPRSRRVEVYRYVAHEYLLAAGIADENYTYSSKLSFEEMPKPEELEKITVCRDVSSPILAINAEQSYWQQRKIHLAAFKKAKVEWLSTIHAEFRSQLSLRANVWDSVLQESEENKKKRAKGDDTLLRYYADHAPGAAVAPLYFATFMDESLCMDFSIDRLPGLSKITDEEIEGESVIFERSECLDYECEAKATAASLQARVNFEQACAGWKDDLKERLGHKLVFADCGPPWASAKLKRNEPNIRRFIEKSKGFFFFTRD